MQTTLQSIHALEAVTVWLVIVVQGSPCNLAKLGLS